jgi:hypothetical protein
VTGLEHTRCATHTHTPRTHTRSDNLCFVLARIHACARARLHSVCFYFRYARSDAHARLHTEEAYVAHQRDLASAAPCANGGGNDAGSELAAELRHIAAQADDVARARQALAADARAFFETAFPEQQEEGEEGAPPPEVAAAAAALFEDERVSGEELERALAEHCGGDSGC